MMFKTTFLPILALFLFASVASFAQAIPSPGFEEWTESGKEPPFDWEEPTGWKSSNSVTEFIRAGVTRSTSAHGGSSSCRMETLNLFGNDVPGIIVNGNPQFDFSTYTVDIMSGGTPFSGRPDELSGYYQFSSTSASDAGYAIVILKKYNAEKGMADTVGIGMGRLEPATEFTAFHIGIEYKMDGLSDSVVIAFLSSDPSSRKSGGDLLIDDIALVTDGSDVAEEEWATQGFRLYPNPASGSVHVAMPNGNERERTIIFYDMLGREVLSRTFNGVNATIDLPLSRGLYTYKISDGGIVGSVMVQP